MAPFSIIQLMTMIGDLHNTVCVLLQCTAGLSPHWLTGCHLTEILASDWSALQTGQNTCL